MFRDQKMRAIRSKRALSPAISSIIMITITVTVSVVVASWMGSITMNLMSFEEFKITDCQWADDLSYADLMITNHGTHYIVLSNVRINGIQPDHMSFVSGSSKVDPGDTAVVRAFQDFNPSTNYRFRVLSARGNEANYIELAGATSTHSLHFVNATSNVDGSSDKGTHSNLANQRAGPDSAYDVLTEESLVTDNIYSLDASGGYMIVGDGSPDWGSQTGTISFWVRMDSSVQGRFWGQHGDMETRWSGTNLVLDWGGTSSMTSATSFTANKWYFVAIVWDESNDNLYLYVGDESTPPTLDSNSRSGTWTSTTPTPNQNRFLNGYGGNEPVNGQGDDLRYWNIARTLQDIQSDYNFELIGSEPNLQSYFRLNNNFDDIGPNNNDGSGSDSYSFTTNVPFINTENYELDIEIQFTDIDISKNYEEICILLGSASGEHLDVHIWNSDSWDILATDLVQNQWNNITRSITEESITLKFLGSLETNDLVQDTWEIDCALLCSPVN